MTHETAACRQCPPSSPLGHERYTALAFPLSPVDVESWVNNALAEDHAYEDVTTIATVQSDRRAHARVVAREDGKLCGVPFAIAAFQRLDGKCIVRVEAEDGDHVRRGDTVLAITGHSRGMLSAERVALNFLQRLSGVASLTARYVHAVAGTHAKILDTRKTTPLWRALEKYAVRSGGGTNHRPHLASAVLIKDNHLMAVQGNVELAIRRSRDLAPPGAKVEIECDRLEQVERAVVAGADIILLDNMSPDQLTECVRVIGGRAQTEASGGITLTTVRRVAETGVDFVSVGALTHSAPALNLALDFE